MGRISYHCHGTHGRIYHRSRSGKYKRRITHRTIFSHRLLGPVCHREDNRTAVQLTYCRRTRHRTKKYRSGYMDGSHLCAPHRFDRTGIVCRMAKLHQLLAVVEEKQAGQEICFCEIMKYRFSTILHHFTEKSVTNNPIDKYFLFLYIYIMNRLYITPLYHTKRLYVSS